jgi:hypothetical protein
VRADRLLARALAQVEPDARLDPQTLLVEEVHEGDRRLAHARGEHGQIVEGLLGLGVEDGVGGERLEALGLGGGPGGRDHRSETRPGGATALMGVYRRGPIAT